MPIRTGLSVISLADDISRREAFVRNAAVADVEWGFFDASVGLAAELAYAPKNSSIAFGRPLSSGELGCYSSHIRLWRQFLASDLDQMIVLEDDLLVDWSFMRLLMDTDFSAQGIGYLRLFSRAFGPWKTLKWRYLEKNRSLVRFLDHVWGTQAYLITRSGAEKLLPHCLRIERPIDWAMDRFWAHGVPNLAVYPYPVVEILAPSRIGDERYVSPPMGLPLRTRRLCSQIVEKGRRALARISPNPRLFL